MNEMCAMSLWSWMSVSAVGLAIFLAGVLAGMKMNNRRSGGSSGGSNRPVRSPDLYIGNLIEDISGEELQKQFSKYGDVREVRMVPPRNGETKTFAFITMGSVEAAQAAMNGMNGKDIDGRKIVVSEARSRGSSGRRGPRR
ncbi:MAG: RNA-binding protein [bacterium]|jgi:cold-inducible RNA-binding protein